MNSTVATGNDGAKDPRTLEHEINQTRAEMDRTLGALERKLSPSHLLDRASGYFQQYGAGAANGLGEFVKNNPLPVALAGLAIGWILLRPKSIGEEAGYASRRGSDEFEEWPRDASQDVAPGLSDSQSNAAIGVQQRVSASAQRTMEKAQHQGDRLKRGMESMAHEQPLLLGALGVLVGAAIGAALPESESERRWLGPARDEAFSKVKQEGRQAYEQVREAAQRGVAGVKQAVADAAAGR